MNLREKAKRLVFDWREKQATPGEFPFLHKMIEEALQEARDEGIEESAQRVSDWFIHTDSSNRLLTHTAYQMANGIRALKGKQ